MRCSSLLAVFVLIPCLAVAGFGQCSGLLSLQTTLASGNSHRGNMFDLVCIDPNNVLINSFEGTWTGTTDLEIWVITNGGSYVGNEMNPGAWTLVGSATGVTGGGPGIPTSIPISVNVVIPANMTQGFYVTSTNLTISLHYSNGTTAGAVFAQDSSLQFLEGCGGEYPFNCSNTPRIWNGNICYSIGGVPPASVFQINTPEASLSLNGVIGGQYGPTIISQTPTSAEVCLTP